MKYVMMELNAPTLDGDILPLYMYTIPMRVLENNRDCIGVVYKRKSYWFDKKYISRSI